MQVAARAQLVAQEAPLSWVRVPCAAPNALAAVLLSGEGDPGHAYPRGMAGKAPPAPLLLP